MKNLIFTTPTLTSNDFTNAMVNLVNKNKHEVFISSLMSCLLLIGTMFLLVQPISLEASSAKYPEVLNSFPISKMECTEEEKGINILFDNKENNKLTLGADNIYWCPGDDLEIPIRGISDDYENLEISIVLGKDGVLLRSTELIKKADGVHTFRFTHVDRHLKIGDNVRLHPATYVPEGSTKPTLLSVDFSNISVLANSQCK